MPHEDAPEFIGNMQVQEGWGVMGLGDESFGIAVKTVEDADREHKSFVKNFSSAWRTRTSQLVGDCNISPGSTRLCCYQERGFCAELVKDRIGKYEKLVSHLLKFVKMHRKRHLIRGRNKGPSCNIPHPLLLAIRWKLG